MRSTECPHCNRRNPRFAIVCQRCGSALPARAEKVRQRAAIIVIAIFIVGAASWWIEKRDIGPPPSDASSTPELGRETPPGSTETTRPETATERARRVVLSYLAQPTFSGVTLSRQVLGQQAKLEFVEVSEQQIYFSVASPAPTLKLPFLIDAGRIEMEREESGWFRLGRFARPLSASDRRVFRTPMDNFKIDPGSVFRFPFRRATYTVSVDELADFSSNQSIFGGLLTADSGKYDPSGASLVFVNHGAYVATRGEPSLRRLADTLTQEISQGRSGRERRVQRLLDFVSEEIEYDRTEAANRIEVMKRPDEVLMTHSGDCSNKTILLGSLLEQIGEDYLFVYTPKHITVAVPQGNFPARNRLSFRWGDTTWAIAESTAPGFRIGIDHVQQESALRKVEFVQRPSVRSQIFDVETGRELLFR